MATTKADLDAKEKEIRATAKNLRIHISAGDGIITAYGSFPANDVEAYRRMESAALEVLRLFRQTRQGTTWGTTSDGVGGQVGLQGGYVRINKSGIDKRLAARFSNNR